MTQCEKRYPGDTSCTCPKCNRAYFRRLNRGSNDFEKELSDGTTIYGPKGFDRQDQSNYHGHYGDTFDRTPHSTIGSAAIGDPHTYDEHKKKRTKRW